MVPFNFYQVVIVSLIFLFLVQCSNINNHNYEVSKNDVAFNKWLNNYKKNAKQNLNISNEVLDKIFKNVRYNQLVINSDSKQAEFTLTSDTYLNRLLTEDIYKKGDQFLKNHWVYLNKVSKTYKVPSYVIVAFLGIETRYGVIKPKYNATEALANLAFNPRRSTFFTKELNSLVVLINKGYVDIDVKSSWAGALGYPQFMPSTYLNYGVDGTGNGKVDLIGNYNDVFVSVANFLRALGWNYYREWGYEVILPNNFNYELVKNKTKYPIYQWANLGVKHSNGKEFTDISALSRIIILDNNKTYLVTSNFDVIMKWNKSVLFAVAVGLLSNELRIYTENIVNKEEDAKQVKIDLNKQKNIKKTTTNISQHKTKIKHKTNKKNKAKIVKPNALKPINQNVKMNTLNDLSTSDNIFTEKLSIFSGEKIN